MSQKNETPILILALLITLGILGAGFWFFTQKANFSSLPYPPTQPSPDASLAPLNPPPTPSHVPTLTEPSQVEAGGITIKIDGSTSMVAINQALQKSFQDKFPGAQILTDARGTDKGILAILTGAIDVAAISRPLNPQEQAQGLVAVPMGHDAIAVIVGKNNPSRKSLTQQQVRDIFQGKITNWSEVGGPSAPIRVINRPAESGTHQIFQSLALGDEMFGRSPNFTTMERDATTPIVRALGKDGISYSAYIHVRPQLTARVVLVDGLTPKSSTYPYKRHLFYVYKNPLKPSVGAFLGFATSPTGQQAIDIYVISLIM